MRRPRYRCGFRSIACGDSDRGEQSFRGNRQIDHEGLAIIGAVLGIPGFAIFRGGQAKHRVDEGGIGAAVSLVLLVRAIAFVSVFD